MYSFVSVPYESRYPWVLISSASWWGLATATLCELCELYILDVNVEQTYVCVCWPFQIITTSMYVDEIIKLKATGCEEHPCCLKTKKNLNTTVKSDHSKLDYFVFMWCVCVCVLVHAGM